MAEFEILPTQAFHSTVFLLLTWALQPSVLVKYRFLKILPYMPELVGFQTMVILDPYSITFNAVGVFGLDFQLLFKSRSSYCD